MDSAKALSRKSRRTMLPTDRLNTRSLCEDRVIGVTWSRRTMVTTRDRCDRHQCIFWV